MLDERGRIALSAGAQQALHLRVGASVVYAVVDDVLVLIPQDQQLAEIGDRATAILDGAGLGVGDLLAALPAARADILRQDYGNAFVDALEHQRRASGAVADTPPE